MAAAEEEVLEQYKDIMLDDLPAGVPPARTHEHEIVEEPGAKPVSRAPYQLSPTKLTDMKKQIEYLLDRQLIRPSTSPYGAPILFTPKPNGSLRMCINYRALNKQTALTTSPVLILPDPDRDYVVEADASDRAVGAVLMQHHERSLQPITYLSKKLLQWEKDLAVVSLDFITGLPSTSRGHDSILVVIDKFSKMGHFILTNATATAEATARLFFDRIITIHGIPATLISDRDPKFTSKFWKELMGMLGTKLAMSSAYHPQTDGQTERLNQAVEQLLRTACKDDVSHWDTQLPTLEFAYNNASHAPTGKTPFFLCYGREPLTPQQPTTPAHVQAAHDFVTTMQQLWEKTQRRLTTMQTSQKQYADRQRRDHSVAVGDQVLLDTRNLKLSHLPSKLRPRFCGPFLVEAQVTPVTFRLRLPDTWKLHNAFHVQLLKPYKDPNQQFQGRQLPPPPPVLFPDAVELPRWHDLLLQNVPIFDLDFDAILAAMYALADITEDDCYLRVPPDPGTVAAALGASAAAALGASASATSGAGLSPLSGTAATESFHTFTLDSGASRSFFRDSTTLTPLSQPVAVSLADPSGAPVLAHFTVLPCPTAPSGLLSGLHLPSFSTNLVSGADLQDAWVDHFTPGGQRVTHCTCSRTGSACDPLHLATFTRRPGSSLYTLTTAPPPLPASGQVAASSQGFAAASRSSPASAPCSCRPLAHETLLWHHRLGHPSLPRLRSMASRALVSGLPRSLPPLPPGPAPTCVPCVEGQQRAAPHSSSFPPTEASLQTLHMDVWGPAHVRGQGHERYFLLVVDDYSCYTTVFSLHSKGEVHEVLIDWIRGARRQLSESFGSDLPVLRLHSNRGGEFSSDLLRAFCRSEGIRQTFTLPTSPQQNGIAERRIGMVMDVARTSMIHAVAPHFLWPFAVQYAARQINLQPRVFLPETTPTLRWMGKVGDASAFHVWDLELLSAILPRT
ncbi:unnamed protein product, partial [Closterium sp. NIES-54]